MEKEVLCETCKNLFKAEVYPPMITWLGFRRELFCIYTHRRVDAYECSFYNRAPKLLTELKGVDKNGYQDINRVHTPTERTMDTRIDCRTMQREAA